MKNILVTGGAGFIGSHTCVELLNAGYKVIVVDNLCNSKEIALERVQEITSKNLMFYRADILDLDALDNIFQSEQIDAVIHFAGLKAVGESTQRPLGYYRNNVSGTLNLLSSMTKHGVSRLVFSSSATVYGNPTRVPITEDFPLGAVNPYGRTKLMIEEIVRDLYHSEPDWRMVILRYFNPVGAHESGRIGEDPQGIPNNLMPFIAQVAVGKLKVLRIFGHDYPTIDGTGVRDYIHVVDLARGHLSALNRIDQQSGCFVYNLGTGNGFSVLQVVKAFEKACGRKIPFQLCERRPGDAAVCYADPTLAQKELGWKAEHSLEQMCSDMWRWQSHNPHGYATI